MAIELYREGDKDEVNGIPCEIGRFHVSELHQCWAAGWVSDPKELLTESEVETNTVDQDQDQDQDQDPEPTVAPKSAKAKAKPKSAKAKS